MFLSRSFLSIVPFSLSCFSPDVSFYRSFPVFLSCFYNVSLPMFLSCFSPVFLSIVPFSLSCFSPDVFLANSTAYREMLSWLIPAACWREAELDLEALYVLIQIPLK